MVNSASASRDSYLRSYMDLQSGVCPKDMAPEEERGIHIFIQRLRVPGPFTEVLASL